MATSRLVRNEKMPPITEPEHASDILKGIFQNYDKQLRPGHSGKSYRMFVIVLCISMGLNDPSKTAVRVSQNFRPISRGLADSFCFQRLCASSSLDFLFSQSCLGVWIFLQD